MSQASSQPMCLVASQCNCAELCAGLQDGSLPISCAGKLCRVAPAGL